jgi:hypothetical protein
VIFWNIIKILERFMTNDEIINNMHLFANFIFKSFDQKNQFMEEFKEFSLEKKYACIFYLHNIIILNDKIEEGKRKACTSILLLAIFFEEEKVEKYLTYKETQEWIRKVILFYYPISSFSQSFQ